MVVAVSLGRSWETNLLWRIALGIMADSHKHGVVKELLLLKTLSLDMLSDEEEYSWATAPPCLGLKKTK